MRRTGARARVLEWQRGPSSWRELVAANVQVEQLGEDGFEGWARLVAESPDGSVYSLPRYLEALCAAAGGRYRILVVRQGDELAAGIALYESDSRHGAYVAPRRLLHYNGPVLRRYGTKYPSEQTARHLKSLTALAAALAGRGYAYATLLCQSPLIDVRAFQAAGWSAAPRYTYVVDVSDLERAWSRVEQNLRRLVGRCERDGTSVSGDGDFAAFHRLHSLTMDRIGQPSYLPEQAFRGYFEGLRAQGLCRLFEARRPDGRVLASQLVLLGPGPLSHTVAAGADPEFLQTGATALLRWKVFEALAGMGFGANDLTDAALNSVAHFKSQLGGELRLCLELEGPRSWRYRLGHGAVTLARRALAGLAARAFRREQP